MAGVAKSILQLGQHNFCSSIISASSALYTMSSTLLKSALWGLGVGTLDLYFSRDSFDRRMLLGDRKGTSNLSAFMLRDALSLEVGRLLGLLTLVGAGGLSVRGILGARGGSACMGGSG